MKLFGFFSIIFLVPNMALTNPVKMNSIMKVKRVAMYIDDCYKIESLLEQLDMDLYDCCYSKYITCNDDYRITEM